MGLLFYYLDKDGVQQGPFNSKQVRELIRIGVILPLTDIRTDQMDRWVHAFNLKNTFPDYVPSQEQPSPNPKSWGSRYALHLVRNPFAVMTILGIFGLVFAGYRSLELPWLFKPNKAPSPVVELDRLELDAPNEVTNNKEGRQLDNRLSGNTVAGEIHRGIMGEQWCIEPSRILPLPSTMHEGRFFFNSDEDKVIFSPKSQKYNFGNNDWVLPGALISNHGAIPYALCSIRSYSQINRNFNSIASTLEGVVIAGGIEDWKKLGIPDRKFNYRINTRLRHILPHQIATLDKGNVVAAYNNPDVIDAKRVKEVAIALAQPPDTKGTRIKMAVSALYPDSNYSAEGRSPELNCYQILSVFSASGKILAIKGGATISSLENNRTVIEEASAYKELAFSRHANYLAGLKKTGEIDILNADTLKLLFKVKGVHMGGPYEPSSGTEMSEFAGHRLCFSQQEDLLLLNDRGQLAVVDIPTRMVYRIPLRGLVETCCFIDGVDIMAASTETSEVYRIDIDSGEVVTKALLAGLGPLTTNLNFSADGKFLSGIFSEQVHIDSVPNSQGELPAAYAMFWKLNRLNDPSSKVFNRHVWSCQNKYSTEHPSQQGSFVGFARQRKNKLSVIISNKETKELHSIPFRSLTEESQIKSILLHSLVERSELPMIYQPKDTIYSYKIPEWKPIMSNTPINQKIWLLSQRPKNSGKRRPVLAEMIGEDLYRSTYEGTADLLKVFQEMDTEGYTDEELSTRQKSLRSTADTALEGAPSHARTPFGLD